MDAQLYRALRSKYAFAGRAASTIVESTSILSGTVWTSETPALSARPPVMPKQTPSGVHSVPRSQHANGDQGKP